MAHHRAHTATVHGHDGDARTHRFKHRHGSAFARARTVHKNVCPREPFIPPVRVERTRQRNVTRRGMPLQRTSLGSVADDHETDGRSLGAGDAHGVDDPVDPLHGDETTDGEHGTFATCPWHP